MGQTTSTLRRAARAVRERMAASSDRSLRPMVEATLLQYLPIAPALSVAELELPEQAVSDCFRRLQALDVQLDAIAAALTPATGPFHAGMTMAAVLRRHPGAQDVLAELGLPGCHGCSVRHDETLEEAVEAYAFDGEDLLRRLNDLLG